MTDKHDLDAYSDAVNEHDEKMSKLAMDEDFISYETDLSTDLIAFAIAILFCASIVLLCFVSEFY